MTNTKSYEQHDGGHPMTTTTIPAIAGDGGTATTGDEGTAIAGTGGTAIAGDGSTAIAGNGGTATAGNMGTATAGHGGVLIIHHYNATTGRYEVRVAAVDGDTIRPGVAYRLSDDGSEFIEAAP